MVERVFLFPRRRAEGAWSHDGRARLSAAVDDKLRASAMLLAAIIGTASVVASVVLLVWVRMADVQAGYEVYRLQREKVKLRQAQSALEVELASLRRPDRLHELARERGLLPPAAERVLRIAREPRTRTRHAGAAP